MFVLSYLLFNKMLCCSRTEEECIDYDLLAPWLEPEFRGTVVTRSCSGKHHGESKYQGRSVGSKDIDKSYKGKRFRTMHRFVLVLSVLVSCFHCGLSAAIRNPLGKSEHFLLFDSDKSNINNVLTCTQYSPCPSTRKLRKFSTFTNASDRTK